MKRRITPLEERIVLDAAGTQELLDSYDFEKAEFVGNEEFIEPILFGDSSEQGDDFRVVVVSSEVRNSQLLKSVAQNSARVIFYDFKTTSLQELSAKISDQLKGAQAGSVTFVGNQRDGKFLLTQDVEFSKPSLLSEGELQEFWQGLGALTNNNARIDLLTPNSQQETPQVGDFSLPDLDTLFLLANWALFQQQAVESGVPQTASYLTNGEGSFSLGAWKTNGTPEGTVQGLHKDARFLGSPLSFVAISTYPLISEGIHQDLDLTEIYEPHFKSWQQLKEGTQDFIRVQISDSGKEGVIVLENSDDFALEEKSPLEEGMKILQGLQEDFNETLTFKRLSKASQSVQEGIDESRGNAGTDFNNANSSEQGTDVDEGREMMAQLYMAS